MDAHDLFNDVKKGLDHYRTLMEPLTECRTIRKYQDLSINSPLTENKIKIMYLHVITLGGVLEGYFSF